MSKFNPQRIKQISYLKDFKCAAQSCVDSCCVGWIINVTPENKKFYEEQNSKISSDLESHGSSEFQIKRCSDGSCSQLENNLCKIQKNFGEAYLPDICYTFPRSYKKIAGEIYMSANLACPESLKVALFNNKKTDFLEWSLVEQSRSKNNLFDYRQKKFSDFGSYEMINIFAAIVKMIDAEIINSDLAMAKLLTLYFTSDQKPNFDWINFANEVEQITPLKVEQIAEENFPNINMRDCLFIVIKAALVLIKIDRARYKYVEDLLQESLGNFENDEEILIKNYEKIFNSWQKSQNKFDQILKNLIKAKLSYLSFLMTLENKTPAATEIALEYLVVKLALMCFNHKFARDLTKEEIIDIIQPITKRFYSLGSKKLQDFCTENNWYNFEKNVVAVLNF